MTDEEDTSNPSDPLCRELIEHAMACFGFLTWPISVARGQTTSEHLARLIRRHYDLSDPRTLAIVQELEKQPVLLVFNTSKSTL
jgi:hypothetical protein